MEIFLQNLSFWIVIRSVAVGGVPEESRIGRGFRTLRSPHEVQAYTPRSTKKERNCGGLSSADARDEDSHFPTAVKINAFSRGIPPEVQKRKSERQRSTVDTALRIYRQEPLYWLVAALIAR